MKNHSNPDYDVIKSFTGNLKDYMLKNLNDMPNEENFEELKSLLGVYVKDNGIKCYTILMSQLIIDEAEQDEINNFEGEEYDAPHGKIEIFKDLKNENKSNLNLYEVRITLTYSKRINSKNPE